MSKIHVNCPYCGTLLTYDSNLQNSDGSVVLDCMACNTSFAICDGSPAYTDEPTELEKMLDETMEKMNV